MSSVGSNESSRLPWTLLLFAGVGVLLALVIGTQVIGVLYALAAPPVPPLPAGLVEITHTNVGHGHDTWLYQTQQPQCDVAAFFVEQGGYCPPCTASTSLTCTGEREFSIFAMRWQADIDQAGITTQIQLERRVSWSGSFPSSRFSQFD